MRNKAMFWVVITTIVLVILAIMAAMNLSFNWIFYTTVLGQGMVVYMVFRVLNDHYTTKKTFEDFYGDHTMDP